jgi:hypothetical protein
MVCVADPGIVCDSPYLDAGSNSITTDGGTFRSASCPGASPPGACRPDFIAGAELTGEIVDTWDVMTAAIGPATFDSCNGGIQTCTLSSPPAGCFLPPPGTPFEFDCDPASIGGSDDTLICHGGKLELNVTGPGVVVPNPLVSIDPLDYPGEHFECGEVGDGSFPGTFGGVLLEDWWVTRQFGATCDFALEYALTFLPRDQIRAIGQEAFPAQLCKPDGMGVCTIHPEPVFVELDGSLTKGCGSLPSNTFTIRFARPNEPIPFESKAIPETPFAVRDVDDDLDLDLIGAQQDTLQINDGSNNFSPQASGLPAATLLAADVADWSNDGNVDLVARTSSTTKAYPGNGAGSFSVSGSYTIDSVFASTLELKEINNDGLPDLVADVSTTRLTYNQKGGAVVPGVDTPIISPQALTDLDTDNDPDIVASNGANPLGIEWAENEGPGTFAVSTLVLVPDGLDEFGNPTLPQELIPLLGQDVYNGVICEVPTPASDCCTDNGNPGCDDNTCETTVCTVDPFCCDNQWDNVCADLASILCTDICETYALECDVTIDDVAGGDADGDGDADLFFSFDLQQRMLSNSQNYTANSRWIAWIPSLQIDDPPTAGGDPLFDVATESWRLLGRAPAVRDEFDSQTNGPSEIRVVDLDGDTDLDVVAVGLWYRNDGGSFSGPFALKGELTRPAEPDILFVADVDDDGDIDVVTADRMWEMPEPATGAMLLAGIAALVGLDRRRRHRTSVAVDDGRRSE